jgi:hypothetical protein
VGSGDFPLPSSLGRIVHYSGGSQTVGAEADDTVPANKSWFVLSVQHVLAKGGTGTPRPLLQITDQAGGLVFESVGSSAAQAVNTTCTYTWAPGLPLSGQIGSGAAVHSSAPLPGVLVLPAGWHLQTNTLGGVGATSNWGTPSFMICELG